jgi:hypothetical protein
MKFYSDRYLKKRRLHVKEWKYRKRIQTTQENNTLSVILYEKHKKRHINVNRLLLSDEDRRNLFSHKISRDHKYTHILSYFISKYQDIESVRLFTNLGI